MKVAKVILKEKVSNEWNPDVANLPQHVKRHLDQWLTPEERRRRACALRCALLRMERDGEIREFNTVLHLRGYGRGNYIEKDFMFYKSVFNDS